MTKRQAKAILVRAFRALPTRDRARLLYHEQKGTPICCGKRAILFADVDGAG